MGDFSMKFESCKLYQKSSGIMKGIGGKVKGGVISLRICYIADGTSIHTQRWLSYFVKKDHQVHLIAYDCRDLPSDNGKESLKGVIVHSLTPKFEGTLRRLNHTNRICLMRRKLRLKELLRKMRPDILHAHYVEKYGWWGAISGFHPFVLTAWGSDIYDAPRRSEKSKQRTMYALRQADLITADSADLRAATIELGAPYHNNHVIQWGVDLTQFNPQIDPSDVRERLHLGSSPVILSSRGFKPVHNTDILIRAIPSVLRETPDAKFILKNRFLCDDTQLRQLVKKLGVSDSVRFVGSVEYSEMPKYYTVSDIFVSIPPFDGTPVSLLEAMACGTAPVVSDVPSVREWIKDGENGFIVPIRDHELLGQAIIRLLGDAETRKVFNERNLSLVREKADHKKHMGRMEKLYYSLTDSGSSGA